MDRLRRVVEDCDLSFYQIAGSIGTTGTRLSMWLAGTVTPNPAEVAKVVTFLDQ